MLSITALTHLHSRLLGNRPLLNLLVFYLPSPKIFERCVNDQLREFFDSTNILPAHQSSFRPRHNCTTALPHVVDDILQATDNEDIAVLILLDFSIAFDMVHYDILLRTLDVIGCNPSACSYVYFNHIQFCGVNKHIQTQSRWLVTTIKSEWHCNKISVKKCMSVPKNILKMFNERKGITCDPSSSTPVSNALHSEHHTLFKTVRTYEKRKDKIPYQCPNIENQDIKVNKDFTEPNAIDDKVDASGTSSDDSDKKKIEIRTVDIRKLSAEKLIDGAPHKVTADQIKQLLKGVTSKNFIVLKCPLGRRKTIDTSELQPLKNDAKHTITLNDNRSTNVPISSLAGPDASTNDTVGSSNLIDKQINIDKTETCQGDVVSNNIPVCVQSKLNGDEDAEPNIKDVIVTKEPETAEKETGMGKIKHFKEKSSTASYVSNNETVIVSSLFGDSVEIPEHYLAGSKITPVEPEMRGPSCDIDALEARKKYPDDDMVSLKHKRRLCQRTATLQKRYIQQEIDKYLKVKMRTRKKKCKPVRTKVTRENECQTEIEYCNAGTQTEVDFQQDVDDFPAIPIFKSGTGPKLEPYANVGETTVTYNVGNNLENLVGNCNVAPSQLVGVHTMGYLDVDNVHGDLSGAKVKDKQSFYVYLRNCIIPDSAGNLPLHIEVMKNDFNEIRKQLIMLNVWRLPIDTINSNNLTPLHLAVVHNCDENIVSFLLDKGADIGCMDSEGNNSMHLAVFHNSPTLLRLLLQKASDTNFNFNNTFNYEGFTPLLLATIEDKMDMVKTFLEFHADPNVRDQKSGRTPLFHAVENDNLNMVQLLLHYGADKKIKNFSGTSTHDAVFELEGISAGIKNMIIGKELFAVNSTRTDKRKKPAIDKQKDVCTKKLRTVKTYRKINMQ
ncbi:hypothetical protein Trydic_g23547 [Trypoxylus dichotomus]